MLSGGTLIGVAALCSPGWFRVGSVLGIAIDSGSGGLASLADEFVDGFADEFVGGFVGSADGLEPLGLASAIASELDGFAGGVGSPEALDAVTGDGGLTDGRLAEGGLTEGGLTEDGLAEAGAALVADAACMDGTVTVGAVSGLRARVEGTSIAAAASTGSWLGAAGIFSG